MFDIYFYGVSWKLPKVFMIGEPQEVSEDSPTKGNAGGPGIFSISRTIRARFRL